MCLVSFAKSESYSALKKLAGPIRPAWGYIVICDDCSHRCSWCYGGFDGANHRLMSFAAFDTVLLKLREMGVVQVSLAGGEPTEHPEFRRFVSHASSMGFVVHIVSHGEHIDREMAEFLRSNDVDQVQVNWQGRQRHDNVHGVPGAYERASAALRYLSEVGVETTVTITVGKYNLDQIGEIMAEAAALDVTRLRVWETTGRGLPFLRGLEAAEIFGRCQLAAAQLGYDHCLSYDPAFEGDVTVPCLQFSNLYMYVTSDAKLDFCGAVPGTPRIADFMDPALSGEAIREIYLSTNAEILGDRPVYCAARDGIHGDVPHVSPVELTSRRRPIRSAELA